MINLRRIFGPKGIYDPNNERISLGLHKPLFLLKTTTEVKLGPSPFEALKRQGQIARPISRPSCIVFRSTFLREGFCRSHRLKLSKDCADVMHKGLGLRSPVPSLQDL